MVLIKRTWLAVLIISLVMLVSGCAEKPTDIQVPGQEKSSQQSEAGKSAQSGLNNSENMKITLYYATKDAHHLYPETHMVPQSAKPAQTALEMLLMGTKNPQLFSVIPEGVKLKNMWIKEHTAYVDFNDKIVKNNMGGSASEVLLVASIVNTLTEFPEISKVQILVEGKHLETIAGHVDVSEPLSRSEKIIKKTL